MNNTFIHLLTQHLVSPTCAYTYNPKSQLWFQRWNLSFWKILHNPSRYLDIWHSILIGWLHQCSHKYFPLRNHLDNLLCIVPKPIFCMMWLPTCQESYFLAFIRLNLKFNDGPLLENTPCLESIFVFTFSNTIEFQCVSFVLKKNRILIFFAMRYNK